MKLIVGAFSAIPTCIISAALMLSLCGIGRAETRVFTAGVMVSVVAEPQTVSA